jgi:small nuclear ribonucleoprotein B and B'
MSMSKTSKLYQFINYRIRVTLQDNRTLVGKFMAFDKHMNLVLGDCEEYRKIVPKGKKGEEREQKRTLGLVLLRGEMIISMTVEGPPPQDDSRVKALLSRGVQPPPGTAQPVGRGITVPTTNAPMPGLTGPIPTPLVGMNPTAPFPGRGGPVPPPGIVPPFPPPGGRGVPGMIPPFPGGRGIPPPPGGRGIPPPPGGRGQ